MFDVGRICIKLAGRDSNKICVVIDVIDDKFVLIDGQTRRRKCNIMHLEPLDKTIKIGKKASHDSVVKELKKAGYEVLEEKVKRSKSDKKDSKKKKEEKTKNREENKNKKGKKASKKK
jgi:large subunit ribosomal protein L14e